MSKRLEFETPTDIVLKNQIIINDMNKLNHDYEEIHGKKRVAVIKTYGCQMNEHDSEKLVGMLKNMGYVIGEEYTEADLIIFNTCCVRENAELKVYGNLGSLKPLKAKKKDLKIAVCGCMMQQGHVVDEIKKKYRHVDLVFGTHNLHNFPHLLSQVLMGNHVIYEVWENEGDVIEGLPIERKFALKAYVNIMYGCNNFCTYCIVPYTRGRERSRTLEDIVSEVEKLVKEGAKEVTLLGQNVNSYGKDMDNDLDFADLLERINAIEGLYRIRFMTPHPKDISDKLLDVMARCDKVCEHLHLPLQAGSNKILKSMNRKYTREAYLEIVKKARAKIKDVHISTDLIIGFPGETEADFEETLDIVKQAKYEAAYTFIYSIRKGTPAADFEDQIDYSVKHDRFDRLLEELNGHIIKTNKAYQDEVVEVLVEGPSKNDDSVLTGRTRQFVTVNFKGDPSLIGSLVNVKITNPRNFSLLGELV